MYLFKAILTEGSAGAKLELFPWKEDVRRGCAPPPDVCCYVAQTQANEYVAYNFGSQF